MPLHPSTQCRTQVWDVAQQQAPLLSFDLGAVVGDVAWAPYSSTVFAAVTDEGRVAVFDVAQNRQLPLCVQKVRAVQALSLGLA
jgi:dynein intermediate chain 1